MRVNDFRKTKIDEIAMPKNEATKDRIIATWDSLISQLKTSRDANDISGRKEILNNIRKLHKIAKGYGVEVSLDVLGEDLAWEPQPEFQGVKGISTDSGVGIKSATDAKFTKMERKLNNTWKQLIAMQRTGADKAKIDEKLKKIYKIASENGYSLSPSPQDIIH